MTQETKQHILETYLLVGTYKKTTEVCGYSVGTIQRVITEFNAGRGTGGNQDTQRKISDEQILQGISGGLTRQEIADKYGVHVENLAKRMRKLGVHAKYADRNNDRVSEWHYTKGSEAFVKKHCGDKFEYVGYLNKRYRIKCKICGCVLERAKSTIAYKNVRCDACEEEKKREKELEKERAKLIRSFLLIKEIKTPKKCACCGKVFYSAFSDKKYCSEHCKKCGNGSIKRRCKKYGAAFDSSVTPEKIFARDCYKCRICGRMCDMHDTSWNGFIGALYPTIDHIIPLAKGGSHTWDNVQCAHAICNSAKRDLILS